MKIQINQRLGIHRATFAEIIRFACPSNVTRTRWIFGLRSWSRYSGHASPWSNEIQLRVRPATKFPCFMHPYQRGQLRGRKYWIADMNEQLVYLIAHEARHLWQKKVARGWRTWGARGRYSEIDADSYAIRTLRAWRRRSIGKLPVGHVPRE